MGAPKGNKFAEGNDGGRPTKYEPDFAEQVYKLCLLGATDAEIADFFEVAVSTVNLWKTEHKEFSDSIKKGKTLADAHVANRLFDRATGYAFDETTYEKVGSSLDGVDDDPNDMKLEVYKKKVITKEIAPDTTAGIFWLKNRQKDKWRDKQEYGITDKDGNDVRNMTDEELERQMAKYSK